jgi:chromosome segregation ATPase
VATLNLLGRLCKDAKDAQQTIKDARDDLTRLSAYIEQLQPHANHNNDDARLLALNILNCAKKVARVRDLLARMERCIERAPPIGRLYTALMSSELKRLLEELRNAKEDRRDAFKTYRYNRSASVRIRGNLKTWILRLRTRNQMVKEDMPPDMHTVEILSLVA